MRSVANACQYAQPAQLFPFGARAKDAARGRQMYACAQRGFTMLELIVVLAIMALVTGLAIPALTSGSGTELRASARTMVTAFRKARNKAVSTNDSAVLTIDVETREFLVPGEKTARKLPDGVDLDLFAARSQLESETRGGIRFFPDGSSTGGRVTLSAEAGKFAVNVDWMTGRIELLEGDDVKSSDGSGLSSRR